VAGEVKNGLIPPIYGNMLGAAYLPDIASQDWGKKSFAERCALNTPIQGTAAIF
jgi:hypothetical protein